MSNSQKIISCVVVCLIMGGGLAVVQAYVPSLFPWIIGLHFGVLASKVNDLEKLLARILTVLESRP